MNLSNHFHSCSQIMPRRNLLSIGKISRLLFANRRVFEWISILKVGLGIAIVKFSREPGYNSVGFSPIKAVNFIKDCSIQRKYCDPANKFRTKGDKRKRMLEDCLL
jgi:hypothetical protein